LTVGGKQNGRSLERSKFPTPRGIEWFFFEFIALVAWLTFDEWKERWQYEQHINRPPVFSPPPAGPGC
jgi:hypothetical protein